MVIIRPSAVDVSIQAVSPVSSLGLSSAASARAGKSSAAAPARPPNAALNLSFIVLPSRLALRACLAALKRVDAGLASADTDCLFNTCDEDVAVAELTGT